MHLFELDQPNPLIVKLAAVSDQLHTELENGEMNPEMSLDELLKYFQEYDIVLDKSDLYDMIKKPPLKNLVHNIQGDKVVFKGFGEPEAPEGDEQQEKIVKQMADRAAKT